MNVKHIAIAGNIGAGKTTLCGLLARHFNWEVHYENAETNPYLSDFYNDMKRWSFNLQVFFLHNRYRQIVDIQEGNKTVIQDRTIYEDAHIFAPNLYKLGLMTERDFTNYTQLFDTMTSRIQPPDLLIYLRASIGTLVAHIESRGREYEGSMSLDYLKQLNGRYEDWIGSYNHGNKLIINVDKVDFANDQADLGQVINRVSAKLHGLFPDSYTSVN